MAHLDSPGWPDPSDRDHDDPYVGRQRARHADAAPDAYPQPWANGSDDAEAFHLRVDADHAPRERGRHAAAETVDDARSDDHEAWSDGRTARSDGRDTWSDGRYAWSDGRDAWPAGRDAWSDGRDAWPAGRDAWSDGRDAWPASRDAWSDGRDAWPAGRDTWSDDRDTWSDDQPPADPDPGWGDPPATAEFSAVGPAAAGSAPGDSATAEFTAVTDGGAEDAGEAGPVEAADITDASPDPAPVKKGSRAGRNLPAAIGVGVTLGGIVLASLFVWRPAFIAVAAVAMMVATWEMVRAVRSGGLRPPMVPLLAGGVAMAGLSWYGGAEALILGLVATAIAALVWRLADGPVGYHRDVVAALLIAVYVPFLGGFAVLLARPESGSLRVLVTLAAVVLSDTGGYVAGVFFGKHPMAPSVSPKKSWEGTAGSLLAAAAGGALMLYFTFDVPWWHGALFGLAVSVASVLGDLAESLVKRDLGIKDMSSLLPGHGGLMDRLDSILFAVPTAVAVLALVAPVAA